MGEHQSGWQKALQEKTGQDVYFWNFIFLMVFTAIEVGAVYLGLNYGWTVFALVSVGIVKFFGIAAFFMHLKGDPFIYTRTALFPVLFVALMMWGIGLSNPDGIDSLPAWCTPNWDYSYVTNK